MARLVYSAITSLDGYIADRDGRFDWSAPDEEVHQFVNDLERPFGLYLYGRRLYDVMAVWQTMPLEGEPPVMVDFATIWRAAAKIVYSRTLTEPVTPKTRIEADFDPEAVRELKLTSTADITVGGADLAGQMLAAGLVDEIHQFVSPVLVGGGTPFLPTAEPVMLELAGVDRFANGVVHLHHRVVSTD